MKKTFRYSLAILSILAGFGLGACDPVDDDATAASFDATQETLDANLIRAMCINQVKCADQIGASWASVDECIDTYNTFSGLFSNGPSGQEDPALYDFDAEKVNACLTLYAEAACDHSDIAAIDAECKDALVGKLVENACCDERGGCGPDLSCTATDEAVGTCIADAQATESCTDISCAEGLYCDSVHALCLAEKALGVACLSSSECVSGLICLDNVCAPSLVVGDACTKDDRSCPEYAECVGSDTAATCQAQGSVNDSCDKTNTTAPDCNMMSQTYCADTNKCAAFPALGEDCSASFLCEFPDLYCDLSLDTTTYTMTGECKEHIALDQACVPGGIIEPCVMGAACDSESSTCVAAENASYPVCE